MRIVKTHPFLKAAHHTAISYKPPASLSYFWNFGVLALLCLVIQFVTGIFLAMHYVSDPSLAFNSVEHIMRDVNYGWLIRYIHANGASMFFLVVYIHIFRGLYYGSYLFPRHLLWISGVIILLLMILTAFMGYVLPWGQMSFWAATVITKLASAVPFIGDNIVTWLWGGYSVGGPTLTRFFSFHYLMPFIIAALVILHILLLHEAKSNNPLGLANVDNIQFTPYFLIKDVFGIFVFFILFSYFLFFDPNVLGHTDNYVKANSMVTPTHIVPEWYFLPFYAILRSVPDKLGGVVLMLASILVLVMFPFITFSKIRSNSFKFFQKIIFWAFAVNCLILGWIGGQSTDSPYYEIGQLSTIYYFLYLIILVAGLNILEKKIWKKFEKKKK